MSFTKATATTNERFKDMIAAAKAGKPIQLNQFLRTLYVKSKQSLFNLTKSEADAEEYFAIALSKFWQKFVIGNHPLPESNIEGYIYKMAKFLCLDDMRSTTKLRVVAEDHIDTQAKERFTENIKTEMEFIAESNMETLKIKAMQQGIKRLSTNCQKLFNTIIEQGIEKSSQLFKLLDLKNARSVTILRYECTKQLKIKAALELEVLLKQKHPIHG